MMRPLVASTRSWGARRALSVTGTKWRSDAEDAPVVTLFTKKDCSLCDDVVAVLRKYRRHYPHSLEAVDITDKEHGELHGRYWMDIPVLQMDGEFWAKHRISADEVVAALVDATNGEFVARKGEPDGRSALRRRLRDEDVHA